MGNDELVGPWVKDCLANRCGAGREFLFGLSFLRLQADEGVGLALLVFLDDLSLGLFVDDKPEDRSGTGL